MTQQRARSSPCSQGVKVSQRPEGTYDVAIIGGGPAGATAGTILRKYNPALRVGIFEKEQFPREHVGESQLPACCHYLHEMGCWDKVEAAGFPIKVGATYRWGTSEELWDFEFLTLSRLPDAPRPHRFEGPRQQTAFQVDRALFDKILLDHARELGCDVHEGTQIRSIEREGDRVAALEVDGGRRVEANWFIDASGQVGLVRRAMGIDLKVPTSLMNIAMWDYWTDTDWAVTVGSGGTRVQILSLDNGWIWFIPIGPTRTSIGFICPAEYYKRSGKTPEELYADAVRRQPRVRTLTARATREGRVRTTRDWSCLAERIAGENWFLTGEAAGFADPILAGGMTLAHGSGHDAACVILESGQKGADLRWMTRHYNDIHRRRILQYIRFADFWYAANGQFTDLQDVASKIAADSGMSLKPEAAFRWLSLGGFGYEDFFQPGLGGLDLLAVREITSRLTGEDTGGWLLNKYNVFKLNLHGAKRDAFPLFRGGRVIRTECFGRAGRNLPITGIFGATVEILRRVSHIEAIAQEAVRVAEASRTGPHTFNAFHIMSAIESMLAEGWILGRLDPSKRKLTYMPYGPEGQGNFHANRDVIPGESPVPRATAG